jgi:hypothetical protein
MAVEERQDASAGIAGRGFVVAADVPCYHREMSHHHGQDDPAALTAVVVEEGVPGVRVLLHVVIDPECFQGLIELLGGSAQRCKPLLLTLTWNSCSPVTDL